MEVQDLLSDGRGFHFQGRADWGVRAAVLLYLDGILQPGQKTIETGAGKSTIVFALRRTNHIAITPNPDEVRLIQDFCHEKKVPLDLVTFQVARSENALPGLAATGFDVALIDGSHAFPIPFLDWFYIAQRLKTGGRLIVDDLQLWTGKTLSRFLQESPEWKVERRIGYSMVFLKTRAEMATGWERQPFVRRRSQTKPPIWQRGIARLKRLASR